MFEFLSSTSSSVPIKAFLLNHTIFTQIYSGQIVPLIFSSHGFRIEYAWPLAYSGEIIGQQNPYLAWNNFVVESDGKKIVPAEIQRRLN